MSKKSKSLTIPLSIPDDKIFNHITDAYGLVCMYRTMNKVPHESIDKWLLRLAVEGCNAIYNYHNQQLKKMSQETENSLEVKNDQPAE